MRPFQSTLLAFAAAGLLLAGGVSAQQRGVQSAPQSKPQPQRAAQEKPASEIVHRVVFQVTQNDPQVMNVALNNIDNMTKYFADKGEKVEVELVAFGAGLHMLRSDTSPVKARLTALAGKKGVTISGCDNTIANQSKQEDHLVTLVPEARVVPTGIARVVELQEQGWSYVRP